jgi:putative membrane protein
MLWYWNGGVRWWGWLFGFLATLVFWGCLFYLVLALLRSGASREHHHHDDVAGSNEDPERTLARRFANGEIDEEEFHRRLDVLRAHHDRPPG